MSAHQLYRIAGWLLGRYALATMKSLTVLVCTLFLATLACTASAAEKLQHVVCFKFKKDTATEDITKVEEAFRELKTKIPVIQSLEWGTNVSKENRDKGFTHCFVLSFKTEEDRDTYIGHPAHKAFGQIVGPVLDDVFVIDFCAK